MVWGIDNSNAIYLAEETARKAGLADRYHCIASSTYRTELEDRVDLLICDHVGFFGFDYGIVDLMRDAKARFLKPGGRMIPQALELMIGAVGSEGARKVASQWSDEEIPRQFHWLDENNRNSKHSHSFETAEFVTAPTSLGSIALGEEGPELFSFKTTLTSVRPGHVDGLAGWFNCQLSENVCMTNNPFDEATIRRAQAFLPAAESFDVKEGEQIGVSLRFRSDDNLIAWTITPPNGGSAQKLTTFNNTVITPADMVEESGRPVRMSKQGEARAFVMGLVDGKRSGDEIIAMVLDARPDLMPSPRSTRDFVIGVLADISSE